MRHLFASLFIGAVALVALPAAAWSQTSITGSNLVYKSINSPTLSQTGYVGTYLTVPTGGATVQFDVNATGSAGHMNVVVGNGSSSFNVTGGSASDYNTQNVTLPAGTYFVRVERDYDNGSNQPFTVNNLSVNTVSGSSAQFSNVSPNGATAAQAAANANNAATTYISNYREGSLNVSAPGIAPGTPVEIKEVNSAFKWGTNVPDSLNNYMQNSATLTTYQSLLLKDFNSITPENGGKWSESDTTAQLTNVDTMLEFAAKHNVRVRMHNLIWGSQQPSDVNTDFTNARSTTPATAAAGKAAIQSRITGRIATYVAGQNNQTGGATGIPATARANQFQELDVYNEDYHTGAGVGSTTGDNYWQVMGGSTAGGATFTANLYNQVQTAVTSVGANTKLFTNEYNVLNNNSDQYGQWYSQNIESIRNAGGGVSGIGTEYYNTPGVGQSGSQVDPSRAYATWQNLSTQGLPIEVTEFGETAVAGANEATALTTAMTLAFGTQDMTGFTLWGYYEYSTSMYSGSIGSVLYDQNFNITAAGTAYEALMKSWTTDDNSTVNADGSISLPGAAFYGDYEAIINGKDYLFSYDPTTGNVVLATPEPGSLAVVAIGLAMRRRATRRDRVA